MEVLERVKGEIVEPVECKESGWGESVLYVVNKERTEWKKRKMGRKR